LVVKDLVGKNGDEIGVKFGKFWPIFVAVWSSNDRSNERLRSHERPSFLLDFGSCFVFWSPFLHTNSDFDVLGLVGLLEKIPMRLWPWIFILDNLINVKSSNSPKGLDLVPGTSPV
jgi:hypothetical protein